MRFFAMKADKKSCIFINFALRPEDPICQTPAVAAVWIDALGFRFANHGQVQDG
jgi:hypothetical protein